MAHGISLWKADQCDLSWGALSLNSAGDLTVTTGDGAVTEHVDLPHSAFVDVYGTDTWAAAAGAADPAVVVIRRRGPDVRTPDIRTAVHVGRLAKDSTSSFGAHAVRFHDRPGADQAVFSWEHGVALIDPDRGCVWSYQHGDPDQRILSISEAELSLAGLTSRSTIDLDTGRVTSITDSSPLPVDSNTLTEWRNNFAR